TALQAVVAACSAFEVDGLRADIVTAKTASALAAWDGRTDVTVEDVRAAALLALPHRRRRGPFEAPGLDEERLDKALEDVGEDPPPPDARGRGGAPPPPAPSGGDATPPAQAEPSSEPSPDAGGAKAEAGDAPSHAAGGEPVTLPVGATFDPVLL